MKPPIALSGVGPCAASIDWWRTSEKHLPQQEPTLIALINPVACSVVNLPLRISALSGCRDLTYYRLVRLIGERVRATKDRQNGFIPIIEGHWAGVCVVLPEYADRTGKISMARRWAKFVWFNAQHSRPPRLCISFTLSML